MVLTLVQVTSAHVLLSAVDHLEFLEQLCNSPSSYFICNPQIPPWHPNTPCRPPEAPTPIDASCSQESYYCGSAWHVISLLVRLMFCQMYPPTTGIWWPKGVLNKVNMTCAYPFGKDDLSFRCTICKLFSRAFLISDEKISSSQVVPWCHNTSDWWCKDRYKLVWREHSLYNISLHCM